MSPPVHPGTAKSILVVEDERLVALDLRRTLQRFGYRVPATAGGVDEALAAVAAERPDLVLMDVHLQDGGDGTVAAEILHRDYGVPVVFLTAYADVDTVAKARASEPYGYLIKPFKPDELRSTVELALYRHEMEGKLREHEQAAMMADRLGSLGTLALGIAHEINNPLTVMASSAAVLHKNLLLLAQPAPETDPAQLLAEALELSGELSQAVERVSRVVADLRRFALPHHDDGGACDPRKALAWALRIVGNELRPRAQLTTIFEAIPPVLGDEVRLGQVFVHLLVNASQAIAPGDPEHNEVRVHTYTAPDGRAIISVRDTGCGMTPEVERRIFEPFFTSKPTATAAGLGLAVCGKIIASLGGSISVQSEPGTGSVFRVSLPTTSAKRMPTPAALQAVSGGTLRGRLLVIDDEPTLLRSIKLALSATHDLTLCADADQARAHLDQGEAFDLVLCDVMMPGLSGIELYRDVLQTDPALASRFVFVTGGAYAPAAEQFLQSVANPKLIKPFTPRELNDAVQIWLAEPPGAAAASPPHQTAAYAATVPDPAAEPS